ncbi:hypothetical protein EUGRSUZ_J02438 [Eucalyptus grandis]|uniref:Uncharacterized protein n=2 Tax=Eucalyptus grandis TaxID=71139 RepID=A0ACC3JB24_EUCGR|nr:hypothetical protein EUGRSUZ_J02438 [Eucalyptus grandis]
MFHASIFWNFILVSSGYLQLLYQVHFLYYSYDSNNDSMLFLWEYHATNHAIPLSSIYFIRYNCKPLVSLRMVLVTLMSS